MKRSLFSLALAGLAVAAAVPAFALDTRGIPDTVRATFNVAEAYPCAIGTYTAGLGIANPGTYCGTNVTPPNTGAAPGILCLSRSGNALNVNCFAVTPANEFGCRVQAYTLFKEVPGSFKCPDVYGTPHFDSAGALIPYRYFQFGTGVRTWWSLNFTQPGTRFLLRVVSACQFIPRDANGNPVGAQQVHVHQDTWVWRVVADVNTLQYVIELMHSGAISTLEIPCILGEDMYDALVAARTRLANAVLNGTKTDVGNAIFDMEALIVSNCLFVEVLNPVVAFPGPKQFNEPVGFQPPGNLSQTVFFSDGGTAVAGIVDTIENPCCCKLLVDLEWIALRNGLIGQVPTLPTF